MATVSPPIQSRYPHLRTARPAGTKAQLAQGRIDWQDVNAKLLAGLEALAKASGRVITIFSGYRTSAYSAKTGGFAGDPHTRGVAVDATVGGRAIGQVYDANTLKRYGVISGNQPNFYKGKPDPPHVQLADAGTPAKQSQFERYVAFAAEVARRTGLNFFTVLGWAQAEGGPSDNPLNLRPGTHYGSPSKAAQATARQLQQPLYKKLWQAAHTNYSKEDQEILAESRAIAASPWNNPAQKGSASQEQYRKNILAGALRAQYEHVPSVVGKAPIETSPGHFATPEGTGDPVADTILSLWDRLGGFIREWAVRGGQIAAGAVCIILGILIIGRSITASQPARAFA